MIPHHLNFECMTGDVTVSAILCLTDDLYDGRGVPRGRAARVRKLPPVQRRRFCDFGSRQPHRTDLEPPDRRVDRWEARGDEGGPPAVGDAQR